MVIFLSGPIESRRSTYREVFKQAQDFVESCNFSALNPATLPDNLKHDAYLPICLAMLEAADAIFFVDGGPLPPASAGSNIEYNYACYQHKLLAINAIDAVTNRPCIRFEQL